MFCRTFGIDSSSETRCINQFLCFPIQGKFCEMRLETEGILSSCQAANGQVLHLCKDSAWFVLSSFFTDRGRYTETPSRSSWSTGCPCYSPRSSWRGRPQQTVQTPSGSRLAGAATRSRPTAWIGTRHSRLKIDAFLHLKCQRACLIHLHLCSIVLRHRRWLPCWNQWWGWAGKFQSFDIFPGNLSFQVLSCPTTGLPAQLSVLQSVPLDRTEWCGQRWHLCVAA